MCLITDQKNPMIAEEDIIVYKAMERGLRSFFRKYPYTLNDLFETKIQQVTNSVWNCCSMIDGEYLKKRYNVKRIRDLQGNPDLICLGEGFSSCDTLTLALKLGGETYECTIPKGSEYYKDGVGYIVSNKIIINKLIQ